MPTNKKKSKGSAKAKGAAPRSNAANKDDLTGLDDILSNPEQMAAAQREAEMSGNGYKPRTGRENAQIGLKGFTQATQNPAMFSDAMSMLGDPSAVKEAEAMMNDPEFKSEINQYMETLKGNPAFRQAMAEAQRKYQALLADPDQMKVATEKYHAMMKAQQDAAAAQAGTGSKPPVDTTKPASGAGDTGKKEGDSTEESEAKKPPASEDVAASLDGLTVQNKGEAAGEVDKEAAKGNNEKSTAGRTEQPAGAKPQGEKAGTEDGDAGTATSEAPAAEPSPATEAADNPVKTDAATAKVEASS